MDNCMADCCRRGSLSCHHLYCRDIRTGQFTHRQSVSRHKLNVDSEPHLLCLGLYGPQKCHGCARAPATASRMVRPGALLIKSIHTPPGSPCRRIHVPTCLCWPTKRRAVPMHNWNREWDVEAQMQRFTSSRLHITLPRQHVSAKQGARGALLCSSTTGTQHKRNKVLILTTKTNRSYPCTRRWLVWPRGEGNVSWREERQRPTTRLS